MSLFARPAIHDEVPPSRGLRTGWTLLLLALAAVVALSFVPAPYVIQKPGPVFNTLGTVEVDGEEVPLIEADATTYATSGSLDLLTASIVGSRATRPSWLSVVSAWFDPSMAVLPLDEVYPEGTTFQQSEEASRIQMQNSQKDAVAAALLQLGYEVPSTLTVESLTAGSPAEGVVEPGDVIVAMNGIAYADVPALREALDKHGTTSPVTLSVLRGDEQLELEIVPALSAEAVPAPIIGVGISVDYDFPVDVSIQLENVGGPSAGMMFALGIIDTLTPGEATGGEDIAGTGTIDRDGTVGAIGGIRQKLYGALDAGAEWFLAPASNCDEVVGHVPDGLTVFSVSTLEEALDAVEAIGEGDTTGLRGCEIAAR
ncbi:PDZ domain-containing protein [Homoserinimonas aerilata]|uniref:endopeptidase La n=1 Tax=Homoserinimonas aerilata TaxID=1162970 RepID=A0A542YHB1_9MICO|nr:S16 family serine protease [Homoserinimonas aerilata]TQL47391.1 PDZ domain-containing protein [Homoserinimonas aerilata]